MSTRQAEVAGAARASPPGAAGDGRRISAGKLSAPRLRPGIVDRPVLCDRLMSAVDAPVVLVSAPAGYGKSTLLALWRERDPRPFAWVSLDGSDNDPVALVGWILAALARVMDVDAAVDDGLRGGDASLEDFVL